MKISSSAPEAIPAKYYPNSDICKEKILSDNKNKSGIYMWTNIINDKRYIGSAMDLSNRLKVYYSFKSMEYSLQNSQSYRYNAILKYGHVNFSLTILEYCSPDKCLEREDYYLCSLPHKYNILLKAGSRSGSKHSDEVKTKISDAAKKIAHSGRFKPGQQRPEGAGSPSQAIEVTDIKNNITTSYNSISAATRALNLPNFQVISNYIKNNQKNPYKARYTFKKVN